MTELIFLLIAALIASPIFVLNYNRYLRNYEKEINSYLSRHGLTFSKKYRPTNEDWKNSPFEKPKIFSISIITVNQELFSMEKYRIIDTFQNNKIWLEITTTFFCKPKLIFKNEPKEAEQRTIKEIENQITDNCPACGYIILENDLDCPACGLRLK